MDTIEASMQVAMALNYLRDRLRERNKGSDRRPGQTVGQIIGRLLMTVGIEMQIMGKRLVRLERSRAGY